MRIWGFDALRYLPGPLAAVGGTLVAALLAALLTRNGRARLDRAAGAWGGLIAADGDPPRRRRVGDLFLPLLLVAVCWALRSRYALLGDNWLRLDQALRGETLLYEWGTMILAHASIRLGEAIGWTPRASLALFNTLAAFPFGIAAARLARSLGDDARGRGWVHLALLGLGGVQLFCGYVEVYAWAFALLALYLAAALRALEGGSLLPAGALYACALALHAVALPFIVPLALLLAHRGALTRGGPGVPFGAEPRVRRVLAPATVALLLGAALLPLLARPLVYAYTAAPGRLALAAPALWWERVNAFVLASPVGTLLGLPLLALATVRLLSGRPPVSGAALFLAAAALPVTLTLLLMQAVLGAADWDIQAFAGLPLALWTAAAARPPQGPPARRPSAAPPPRVGHRAAAALSGGRSAWLPGALFAGLVVISLGNTWGFIAVNAGESSVRRIQEVLRDDPAPYYVDHPAPLHLAFLFESNGLREPMYAALEEGVRRYPDDPRMAHNLASAHFRDGDLAQAKRWAREASVRRPGYVPPIHLLFVIAERERNAEDIVAIGEILLEIEAREPDLANRYVRREELARIREVVRRAGGRDPGRR